ALLHELPPLIEEPFGCGLARDVALCVHDAAEGRHEQQRSDAEHTLNTRGSGGGRFSMKGHGLNQRRPPKSVRPSFDSGRFVKAGFEVLGGVAWLRAGGAAVRAVVGGAPEGGGAAEGGTVG